MRYRLGDICTITKGETGIMKAIPGVYTMVTSGEVNKTHNKFQFDTKAVIIPLVSSTGHGHASMKRVKFQDGKFALGSILCAVVPKDEKVVLAKYLHIFLHWNREELLVSQMKGMANVSLPINKIADVLVSVPSIVKQQEIIDLEVQLVEKELLVEKLLYDQLTQLENLNQSILQDAVQGKLVKQVSKDESASELLKLIQAEKAKSGKKDKPLPSILPNEIPFEIPKNWSWCRLGDISKQINDGTHFTPKYVKNGVPFLSIKDISSGKIDFSNTKFITKEEHIELIKRCNPTKNDILFCRIGTLGRPSIIETDIEFSIFVSLGLIKTYFNIYEVKYLKYLLESPFLYNQYQQIKAEGIHTPKLNLRDVPNLLIPLPPLSEQKRIVAEIEKQLAKTKQLKECITTNQQATKQLLKALLHEAFEVEERF